MAKVNRLPTALADQIAAGEVVERPASVVKELVENALDARARRIAVTVELGGKRLIRVEDDGEGMTPEDARLSIERHATSKLAKLDDLGAIATLGFRGEALPSIASVSHLTLRTKPDGASYGIEIRVDGGTVGTVRDVGMADGTVVEVADLFFNVPARRKFLKSDGAEASQIARVMTQLALGYPDVGFELTSRGRRRLECAPVAGLRERFFQLYGDRADLVEVERHAAGIGVTGFVATLGDHGAARGPQNIFVNRRPVKDRTVSHAIHEAYSQATIKPRSPEVHLFIDLPVDRVDVNVHPTKAEVRFLEQSLVHELLRRALGEALGRSTSVALGAPSARPAGQEPAPRAIPGVVAGMAASSRWSGVTDLFRRPEPAVPAGAAVVRDAPTPIPLGQFRDTFIVAVDNDGVAIVDQHVAHERILFEQVMEQLTRGPLEGQRLLEAIVIELPSGHRDALVGHTGELDRLGFEIEAFGGASVRITTVPGLLARAEAEHTVRALAADLDGQDTGGGAEDVLRRLAATTACHAAVKANDRLTQEKMYYILSELRRAEYASVCPHGRPVVLRLDRHEIERRFER